MRCVNLQGTFRGLWLFRLFFIHGIISSFAMFLDEEMKGLDFMYNFN